MGIDEEYEKWLDQQAQDEEAEHQANEDAKAIADLEAMEAEEAESDIELWRVRRLTL